MEALISRISPTFSQRESRVIFLKTLILCVQCKMHVQSLEEQTDFLGFSIQNRAGREGRKLPKSYVKSTIFFSIACTNVERFSMSFGCKIFSDSGDSSCQIFNIHFSLLKLTFFGTFKFEGL